MQTDTCLPINFKFSSKAWAEIEVIKKFYDRNQDKADVLMVGWGMTILNNGNSWSHVVVGFYRKSERIWIQQGIQIFDGHEIVFFITPESYDKFEGKTIVYEKSKGFFLGPD